MTYKDDVNILRNMGRVVGALAVDTPVATVQDALNITASLYANSVNNVADDKEWSKRFSTFWSDAWKQEGGVKDILIDGGLELFSDITGYRLNPDSSIFKEGIGKYFKNESWRDPAKRLLTRISTNEPDNEIDAQLNSKISPHFKLRVFQPSLNKFFDRAPFPANSETKIPRVTSINSAVSDIFDAGPLLFSNMFDVAFILNKKPNADVKDIPQKDVVLFLKNVNNTTKPFETTKVQKDVLSSDFSVRVASVSIPFPTQTTFQTKVLGNTMERPTSTIEFDNLARLSIDMDANLYYLDLFNGLAGHGSGSYLNSSGKYSSIDHTAMANLLGSPYYELCIAATSRTLHRYSKYQYNPVSESGDHSNICYIFRDVKFLGGSKIEFNKSGASTVQGEFEFIFRTVDPIYKTSEKVERDSKKNDILRVAENNFISEEGITRGSIKV